MSKFNFQRVIDNIEQAKKELPVLLANDAQKYFLASFKQQGWDGKVWDEVKRRIPGTKEYEYPKNKGLSRQTKPILQGTGVLRREVSLIASNAEITYDRFNFRIRLSLDDDMVPYGKYINEGTDKMVQRKFMGDSPALRAILRARIERYFNQVWK